MIVEWRATESSVDTKASAEVLWQCVRHYVGQYVMQRYIGNVYTVHISIYMRYTMNQLLNIEKGKQIIWRSNYIFKISLIWFIYFSIIIVYFRRILAQCYEL